MAFFAMTAIVSSTRAQMSTGILAPDILRTTAASYYYVAKAGELTMQVNVWGFVPNPGRYEVPTSTNLIQLLSYAGGPLAEASTDDVKVTRAGRDPDGSDSFEYTVDIENLAEVEKDHLLIYPGDTIFIDHGSWLNVRDALLVVTTLAVVTSAVAAVIIAESRTP
jgi:hypothetical protein